MTVKIRKLLWSVIGSLARKASNQYIAGPEIDDAQRVCNYLSGLGYWVTQGYWNSADDEPADVLGIYQASLDWLARLEGKNYLSIKVPSLHFDSGLFGNLLARSHLLKVPVLFDSLAPEQTDRTLALIRSAAEAPFADIGCTLPGRWRRSVVDADLANELGLNVRVVKGQWKDPDYPDSNPRSGYLQVIDRLAGKSRCVRVATHDLSLARDALGVLVASNTCCELELLYGLPTGKLIALAAEFGVPVRFYVAFGYAYLPYALSDLTKHPKMILPFMREVLKGNYLSTIPDFSRIKRNCGK